MTQQNKKLTKDMLLKGEFSVFVYPPEKNVLLYYLDYQEKRYIVQRKGKCEPNKCNSACCKFIALTNNDYIINFKDSKGGNHIYIDKVCSKLNEKCNTCRLWGKKLPEICQQFPHPHDGVYYRVRNKCSFYFEILHEVVKNDRN